MNKESQKLKAGFNWVLVTNITPIEDNGFELSSALKPFWATVISVGSCDTNLYDGSLIEGVRVLFESNSRGVDISDNITAFRRTQIVAIN